MATVTFDEVKQGDLLRHGGSHHHFEVTAKRHSHVYLCYGGMADSWRLDKAAFEELEFEKTSGDST